MNGINSQIRKSKDINHIITLLLDNFVDIKTVDPELTAISKAKKKLIHKELMEVDYEITDDEELYINIMYAAISIYCREKQIFYHSVYVIPEQYYKLFDKIFKALNMNSLDGYYVYIEDGKLLILTKNYVVSSKDTTSLFRYIMNDSSCAQLLKNFVGVVDFIKINILIPMMIEETYFTKERQLRNRDLNLIYNYVMNSDIESISDYKDTMKDFIKKKIN